MSVNLGFFANKFLGVIYRPALRSCRIDKRAHVGSGSNCINVTMGKYSYMGKNNSVTNATIGSFCSIASYCAIGGGAHDMNAVSTSPVFHDGRNAFGKHFSRISSELNREVRIGNDVWIGEKVFISDGISIGDGAIVGAHSVVTHDVPPYAIVAGAPAKILRYRFDEETINALLEIEWWNWNDAKLQKYADCFENPEKLMKELLSDSEGK